MICPVAAGTVEVCVGRAQKEIAEERWDEREMRKQAESENRKIFLCLENRLERKTRSASRCLVPWKLLMFVYVDGHSWWNLLFNAFVRESDVGEIIFVKIFMKNRSDSLWNLKLSSMGLAENVEFQWMSWLTADVLKRIWISRNVPKTFNRVLNLTFDSP